MALQQFRREFRVQIGDVSFDSTPVRPLTFRFNVERDLEKPPNNASMQVLNLSRDSRSLLQAKKFVPCKVDVGYQEGLTQIFFGDLRRASSTKVGPDWVTSLDAGDGEKKITQLRVAKTFKKGTALTAVLKSLTQSVGLGVGNIDFTGAVAYPNGRTDLASPWTASGNAADELEFFARSVGLRWSAQDGQMMIAPVGTPAYSGGPLISPKTGLIGSPTLDSDGKVQLTSLMLPDLLPGHAFELDSAVVSGKFLATHTIHSGDTTGMDWHVQVKGTQLK